MCGIKVTDTLKTTTKISLQDFDITELNEDSVFSVIVNGDEVLSVSLGDDPKYKYGKNKAKIVINECEEEEEFCEYYGNTTINLSWNKKQLTASIVRKVAGFSEYTDVPECKKFKGCNEVEINFGDVMQTFHVNYSGKNSTKRVVKGEDEYYVTNSSFSGKATSSSVCNVAAGEEVCY